MFNERLMWKALGDIEKKYTTSPGGKQVTGYRGFLAVIPMTIDATTTGNDALQRLTSSGQSSAV